MPLRRTIGGYVTANPVAPAGPYQDGAADGVWTLPTGQGNGVAFG